MRILEINTWPWLSELSERYGRQVTLDTIPDSELDTFQALGFDALWLMGVWKRSPEARSASCRTDDVVRNCADALPAFNVARDIVGSPYAVGAYEVAPELGGRAALAAVRTRLRARGLKLFLDFVPNHTAPDHDWLSSTPNSFVQGTSQDLANAPTKYFSKGGSVFAYGGGGAWVDTAQLNAFSQAYRHLASQTLQDIGDQCDGVRCDMAHLLLTNVFSSSWGSKAGAPLPTEFWADVISAARGKHPDMLFMAEAYGDTEWSLQQLGFNFCYDKEKFYDRLKTADVQGLRAHLGGASPEFLKGLVHFIENHDEDPADRVFVPAAKHRLAAVAMATIPGPSLWHYLQFEGRWGKQQVQLGPSVSVRSFYHRLLRATNCPALRNGQWTMCQVSQANGMIAWGWEAGDDRVLVVLNLSEDEGTWGRVTVPWQALKGANWTLTDLLSGDSHLHSGNDMVSGNMFVRPKAWGANLFKVSRA